MKSWPYGYSLGANPLTEGPAVYQQESVDIMARAFAENWEKILARARALGEDQEPRYREKPSGELSVAKCLQNEAGCGYLGCVYETFDAETVFKITADAFEAGLIKVLLDLERNGISQPQGIVQYKAIYRLDGLYPHVQDSTELYAIWREAAHAIGYPEWMRYSEDCGFSTREVHAAEARLDELSEIGHRIGNVFDRARSQTGFHAWLQAQLDELASMPEDIAAPIKDHQFSDVFELAKWVAKYNYKLSQLRETHVGKVAADALREFSKLGIILPDLHGNNIGHVERLKTKQQKGMFVITDPSICIFLSPAYWNALFSIEAI